MKNKVKKIITIMLTLSVLWTLSACGNSNIQIDIAKMGVDFSKSSIFSGQMTEVSKDQTIMKYMQTNLQSKKDVADAISYVSTGNHSDEIAIFECTPTGNMANITNGIMLYVRGQKEKFSSNSAELKKLNSAVIINKGKYAFVCISKDSAEAKKFIKKYLSK